MTQLHSSPVNPGRFTAPSDGRLLLQDGALPREFRWSISEEAETRVVLNAYVRQVN
jgi:hypothetical protein